MSMEIIYTSAPRGLNANVSGFCTVAATENMPREIIARLEGLCGYEPAYDLSDKRFALNPVSFIHTRLTVGGEVRSVLSRIAFCGADYSGRANKIAHHVLLEPGEMHQAGPAWMLYYLDLHVFRHEWEGEPRRLPARDLRAAFPSAAPVTGPAKSWQERTGDAGWGGALAKAFVENPKVPTFVIYDPGTELLPLLEESMAVLPAAERWKVGLTTYYSVLPVGCQYHWRGVLAGSVARRETRRFPEATVIDLSSKLLAAGDGPFATAARQGCLADMSSHIATDISREADEIALVADDPPGLSLRPAAGAAPTVHRTDLTLGESGSAVRSGPSYRPRVNRRKRRVPMLIAVGAMLAITAGVLAWIATHGSGGNKPPAEDGKTAEAAAQDPPSDADRRQPPDPETDGAHTGGTRPDPGESSGDTAANADPEKHHEEAKPEGPATDSSQSPPPDSTPTTTPLHPDVEPESASPSVAETKVVSMPQEMLPRSATEGQVDTRYDVSPVYSEEEYGQPQSFTIGPVDTILKPPIDPAKVNVSEYYINTTGVGAQDGEELVLEGSRNNKLVSCRVVRRGAEWYLTCTYDSQVNDAKLRWMVIELASQKDKRVYQCPLGRPKVCKRTVAVAYEVTRGTSTDTKVKAFRNRKDPETVVFKFPWPPESMPLQVVSSGEKAKSVELAQSPKPLRWPIEATGVSLGMYLEVGVHAAQGPDSTLEVKLTVESKLFSEIENRIEEKRSDRLKEYDELATYEKALTDWRDREEYEKLKKDRQGQKKRYDDLHSAEVAMIELRDDAKKKIEEAELPIQRLLDAIAETLKAHTPLTVTDPWGLTVAEITVALQHPSIEELVRAEPEKQKNLKP